MSAPITVFMPKLYIEYGLKPIFVPIGDYIVDACSMLIYIMISYGQSIGIIVISQASVISLCLIE